jgi:hypothetical protein
LLVNTKRHWTKLLVGGLLCYGTQITFNPAPNMHSTATILPSVTRSIPTVATQAQALVPATTVSIHAKEQYIARFVGVAQGEMKKYGIPASVILSLSIIESNYGTTPLAQAGNNYFALSCAANSLAEGIVERAMYQQTCYVHYENAWTSFRANSLRLGSANFQALKGEKDYHTWAAALEQQGLVEAVNLVGLIELHQLHQYDSVQEK